MDFSRVSVRYRTVVNRRSGYKGDVWLRPVRNLPLSRSRVFGFRCAHILYSAQLICR